VPGDDVLQEAVDELYSADPDEFMQRRGALVAAAKKSGAAAIGKQLAALRKPTRSAYAVNMLARADPDRIDDLIDLGGQLREAERSVDAKLIRELTGRRRRLVDELTKRAFDVISDDSPSSAVRDVVVSTLTAALADTAVADQIADGTLVKPARWEGFGFGGAPDLTVVPSPSSAPSTARPGKPAQRTERSDPAEPADQEPEPAAKPAARKRLSADQREEQRRLAAELETERKAQAKAAAEDAKRQALDDARKAADDAEEAVILATDEEETRVERLRLLEEQVAEARRAVDEARIQLRRAEIRQRRATDTLRRLER
jgi:hypothetical protein